MFERFTDQARRAVVLAQQEARVLKHHYIGTEHVLLGLLTDPDGVTCQALASLGIDPTVVRQSLINVIGEGTEVLSEDHIPFTPRSKKVLELALRESLQLGHNYIGTEHIFLALMREGEGVAAQVLVQLGADPPKTRATVISMAEDAQPSAVQTPRRTEVGSKFPAMLSRFTTKARMVVATAEEASRVLNHNYVGTEHLLLGLMADSEAASARALAAHGLDVAAIQEAVVGIVGQGVEGTLVPVRTPFTPRAKGVLEFSLRESLKLGRNYVDTEAILLGLIRVGEGIATQVLTRLGVDLERLRVTVMELIGIHPESGEPTAPVLWGASPEQRRETCGHLPANLSIEVHDIPSTASDAVAAVRLVVCTACGTTLGVA